MFVGEQAERKVGQVSLDGETLAGMGDVANGSDIVQTRRSVNLLNFHPKLICCI